MLRVTKAEEQAVRLVMRLAAAGDQRTLAELAEREGLPEPTVAKLLGMLRRGQVVEAVRGRNGGYTLGAAPEEISVAQIVRAVGSEPAAEHACLADPDQEDCPRIEDCGLRSVWRHLQRQVTGVMERTTVADLLSLEDEVTRHVRRVWPLELRPEGADEDRADRAVGGA